jgi:hypothetical protein
MRTGSGSESGSKSELLYDSLFAADQFILVASPLRLTTSNFIFQLNTCGYNPYITPSLTIGWAVVYNCCWSSPAHSFSGPSPAGLMTTFYCLRFQIRNPEGQVPVFNTPGTGWPGHPPRHWVPFSSLPTIRRAAVEVLTPPPQKSWFWIVPNHKLLY